MKNMISLSAIIMLFFLMVSSSSCGTIDTKNDIIKEAEEYVNLTTSVNESTENTLNIHFGYQKELGKWLDEEIKYIYDENGDNSNGIDLLEGMGYKCYGDRLFLDLARQTELSTGEKLKTYINIRTGEKHYVCPDPLCEHKQSNGCLYIKLSQLTFHPENDMLAYSTRLDQIGAVGRYSIFEMNFDENTIKKIYSAENMGKDADVDYLSIFFISENILYFKDRFVTEEVIEGKTVMAEETYLIGLDLETGKFEILSDDFPADAECICIKNNRIFFRNTLENRIYCTDLNYENETDILIYEDRYTTYESYYDNNTEELYILISDSAMHNNVVSDKEPETAVCKIYCIDNDLLCSEVPISSNLVMSFQLTNEYIYYTVFDIENHNAAVLSCGAYDVTGSKLYRVRRNETTNPELVFDGRDELFLVGGYFVTGDYLYINYCQRTNIFGNMLFKRMGSSVRINMADNTLKWINLD